MNRQDRSRPYSRGDPNMYDDDYEHAARQRRNSSSHSREHRNGYSRAPYQEDRDMDTSLPDRGRQSHGGYATRYDERQQRSGSPRYERAYNDRDREDYRTPDSAERSRSPMSSIPPNRTVRLEQFHPNMTREDVRNPIPTPHDVTHPAVYIASLYRILAKHKHRPLAVRYSNRLGSSKRVAYVDFATIQEAVAFIEPNFPSISFTGSYDQYSQGHAPPRVLITYCKPQIGPPSHSANDGSDKWICDSCFVDNYAGRFVCFRCKAARRTQAASQVNASSHSGFTSTGDSDVSVDKTPSQFLMIRGLEPGVSEELLAKGVSKLYKRKEDDLSTSGTPAKKIGVQSTKANEANLGAKQGTLQRVLLVRDRKSNESWKYGFAEFESVGDAQAAMAKYEASEKFTIASKPVLVSYIHAGVFVPVFQAPPAEFSRCVFSPLHNSALMLKYWDDAAYVNILVTAIKETKSLAESKEKKQVKMADATSKDASMTKLDEPAKKRKADKDSAPNAKKQQIAPHLQYWTNRHAELHGVQAKENDKDDESASAKTTGNEIPPPRRPHSFIDWDKKICLLCTRQFETDVAVRKHEQKSKLHKESMENEEMVAAAIVLLTKAGLLKPNDDTESQIYRDRAKERREAFSQPKQPAAQHNRQLTAKAPAKEEEVKPTQSKGAALLGKMGWTAGTGLGAQGTGRTEAISTDLYAQGVGLGAEGGKVGDAIEEANRTTKGGYGGFVLKAKEKAKERYQKM